MNIDKKELFDYLVKRGIIKPNDNWELTIAGNKDGIRWIEKKERIK